MANDQRRDALRRSVAELAALEREMAEALAGQAEVVRPHPDAAAAVERVREMAERHGAALAAYLDGAGGHEAGGSTTALACLFGSGAADGAHPRSVSAALRAAQAAVSYVAMGYATLSAAAFRLYDPPLRELAPAHLGAYAEAARAVNRLVAGVVAWELEQEGLGCHCVCPMCSIGACGCVAIGTEVIDAAWREAAPGEAAGSGFPLLAPRSGSQLAHTDVRGGDRLLAVDGQLVRSFRDVQTAIRKHQVGEEVRLLVQRGAAAPQETRVTHVGDYPPRR